MTLRIISWNIRHGGRGRASAIAAQLATWMPQSAAEVEMRPRFIIQLLLAAIALTLRASALVAQQSSPFTLDAALSAPFPSGMVAAPKGGAVAWVMDDRGPRNIWVAEPPAYRGRRLTSYTADDGQEIAELAWSPDGRTILYVRGGEGTRIAFLRVPTSTAIDLFAPVRRAQPWSIMLGDASSGTARELWRASAGDGSAFNGVVADDQLFWGEGDRIVFPWEKDGWCHLYSLGLGGGAPELLTPGEFEVEHVTMTPDRTALVFSSNQGDIDRRHLWRVAVRGGPPVSITNGKGLEWSPAVTSDGRATAFLRSTATHPAHAAIIPLGGEPRELAPDAIPATLPERQLVEPESVVYAAADGMRIHGQIFRPPGLRPGERRPAVIFIHGGSRRQMLLGWHYMNYYNFAYAMNQYMASKGYVVLAINYRSGIGYGMQFREAERYGATGASEFNDVLGAGLYLRARGDVDPARIGVWGGSYGGYLTAHALAQASDLFAAGVDIHGVHDWNVGIRTFIPSYNKLEDPEKSRLAFQSSPMSHLDGWRSPVLVIHGDDDRNVSFSETVALVEKLRERGIEPEQLIFPDEIHDFLLHRHWLQLYGATAEFFDRKFGVLRTSDNGGR